MNFVWPRFLNPRHVIQLIQKQKNPSKALQIFNQAEIKFPNYHHNGSAYATMINILANSNRISEMRAVIDQMREDSCECKDYVFAKAIKTYAKAGLLEEAISLFETIPQFNCVNWTETLNTILQVMANESKLESVCSLFLEKSHGWEVKTRIGALNLLISTLCQHKCPDLALHIFQEMNYHICPPDRDTYRILMKGLCENKRLNEAIHLLYSMFWRISQKGSGEDVVVYRTLLETLCENSHVDQAIEILDKILRKGLGTSKKRNRLKIVNSYEGVDIQQIKASINEALVKGLVPSSISYCAMAIDLYSENKIDEANMVVYEMNLKQFKPPISIYEAKLSALFRVGRVNEAINVVEEEMVKDNCVPTVKVYNILISGLCKDKRSILATKYLDKMSTQVGCSPNKESYAILVDGLCCEGGFIKASKFLEQMMIRLFWPSFSTFSLVIPGLCMLGKQYEAVMWLEEMVSQGMVPDYSIWDALVNTVCDDVAGIDVLSLIIKHSKRTFLTSHA